MVRRLFLRMLAVTLRGVHAGLTLLATNARTLVCVCGLLLMHVGLRAVEPWAPGVAWSVPGAIITGISIFGARGGASAPPARRT